LVFNSFLARSNKFQKRVPRINLHSPFERGKWATARRYLQWRMMRLTRATMHVLGAGKWLDPRGFEARYERVCIANLPAPFHGLKLAHLSDFHCGAYMSESAALRVLERAWEDEPDLVALTGDFVEYHPEEIRQIIEPLKQMPAPPLGIYAVLGNHDYMMGKDEAIVQALREANVRCLRNESIRLEKDGQGIWLTGVEDHWRGTIDFHAALSSITTNEPRILLCHTPDVIGHARDHGYALMLSGHTHGGQWVLPMLGPAKIYSLNGKDFIGGSVQVGPTRLHVSRGIGMATLPLRINCPPEFTILTLCRD